MTFQELIESGLIDGESITLYTVYSDHIVDCHCVDYAVEIEALSHFSDAVLQAPVVTIMPDVNNKHLGLKVMVGERS